MRGEQKIIVGWMRRQLKRLQWKPERWAREAKLAPTTVTRAMADNYESVSSVPTLHALARAAHVPSILDYLSHQSRSTFPAPLITEILQELLPASGCHLPEEKVALLGQAISQTLNGLAEQGQLEGHAEPSTVVVLARAARAVFYEK